MSIECQSHAWSRQMNFFPRSGTVRRRLISIFDVGRRAAPTGDRPLNQANRSPNQYFVRIRR
ncbi:hypothetical protein BO71DRAFT_394927 [Aspergillus ellipticus CBS 707.79]|uniref:Uncharacterized protein n=1 Tax=Aspergillus ellipticus CBS 707.79 TaxID=1448320 RepID=A0A319E545_9EURO|nr:hypothetical protein BO71DRAFT_394927 [Aspergillus ellipticus CBS 707.79]